jgi:hypothetical protein
MTDTNQHLDTMNAHEMPEQDEPSRKRSIRTRDKEGEAGHVLVT